MSKFLKIPNGDYKIEVQQGGVITLDTGLEQGTVVVTGDLEVRGNTTTVQSEDLVVRDNIIVVNDGETGPGITLDIAGIQVDRGSEPDAFFLFDEGIQWADPATSTTKNGAFVIRNGSGTLVGLRTNSISTGGSDLFLINSGNGVVSVTGTNNYENQVQDDDDIPNKKYVDDSIDTAFSTVLLPQIGEGTISPTRVAVRDIEESAVAESQINFDIDSINIGNFYSDRFELGDLRIIGTTIETLTSNEDLTLSAPGTGEIVIDDTLRINSVPSVDDATLFPAVPADGVKIYIANESTGNTGIYFVNQNQTRDEVISRNRALIFSMIF
jgi:hypothetical protein